MLSCQAVIYPPLSLYRSAGADGIANAETPAGRANVRQTCKRIALRWDSLLQGPPTHKDLEELQTPANGPDGRTSEYASQDHFWFNDLDGKMQWVDPGVALLDGVVPGLVARQTILL